MKIHLMITTAMLCFCVTHSSEAQEQDKRNTEYDQKCNKNGDCKSDVCTNEKCAYGTKIKGTKVKLQEECEGGDLAWTFNRNEADRDEYPWVCD